MNLSKIKKAVLTKRFKRFRIVFILTNFFTVITDLVFAILKRTSDYERVLSDALFLNIILLFMFGFFALMFSTINRTFQKILFLGFLLVWSTVFVYSLINLFYINRQPMVASGILENKTLEECLDLTPKTRSCGFYNPSPYSYPDESSFMQYRVSVGLKNWNYKWKTIGTYGKTGIMTVLSKLDKYMNSQVHITYNYSLVSIQSERGCYIYRALDPYYKDANTEYCL